MTSDEEKIIEQLARELPAEVGVETPDGTVYHYTDAAGLQGMLRSGKVWATHFAHLNDRRELREGEDLVRDVATSMKGTLPSADENQLLEEFLRFFDKMAFTAIAKDVYVSSFSEAGDDLSQWRAYGGRGGGYCVGLKFHVASEDQNKQAEDRGLGQTMRKVRYDRDAASAEIRKDLGEAFHAIRTYGRTFQGRAELVMEIYKRGMVIAYMRAAKMAPVFKHESFKAEQEWRLIATLGRGTDPSLVCIRSSPHGVVPYLELDLEPGKPRPIELETIIVGPTQDPDRGVHATKLFLRSIGYATADAERLVVRSNVPFRG
jgi:hypothetical protein